MERMASPPASTDDAMADARACLRGRTPKEILSRIVPGDPLRLRARVACHLESQALLLDADRVHLRALALCARAAVRYRGQPDLCAWLDARVDEALREILEEGDPPEGEESQDDPARPTVFDILAEPLGLDAREMARACARFQRLPFPERRAFFDLVLHARSLDELARPPGESATEIARRARRALHVLLAVESGAQT